MYIILILLYLAQVTTAEHDNRIITTLKYSTYRVKPVIVNGDPVQKGQVPYMVSIKEAVDKVTGRTVWKNICGGSIIHVLKVLTAAHCFETNDFYYAKHPQELRAVAGELRNEIIRSGATESTHKSQWRTIQKVFLHKDFNFPNNDIAVAYMDQPWRFNNAVNYVTIAGKAIDYSNYCASAGYGRTGPSLRDAISPVLLVARINVMSRWQCSLWWEMNMNSFICSDSALSDVARGDSGGPLVCRGTEDPNEQHGKDLLVGVVSGKNYDTTTLYTRVSAYKDWIGRAGCRRLGVDLYLLITVLVLIYLLFDFRVFADKLSLNQN